MVELLGKDKEDDDSCDVRHRARITQQQQQHFEELKKLNECFKQKEGKQKHPKEAQDTESKPEKEEAAKSKAKKVDVSKKKSIFTSFKEAFGIKIDNQEWERIIVSLRSLFHFGAKEALLAREIKYNNKIFTSLLARLKDQQNLTLEMRVAALLKEIIKNPSLLSLAELKRLLTTQAQLTPDLNKIEAAHPYKYKLELTKTVQHIQNQQTSTTNLAAERSLADQSKALDKIKAATSEFNQWESKQQVQPLMFKVQDLNQQSQYYFININPQIRYQNQDNKYVVKLEQMLLGLTKDILKEALTGFKDTLLGFNNIFSNLFHPHRHHGDKNCNTYNQKHHHGHNRHLGSANYCHYIKNDLQTPYGCRVEIHKVYQCKTEIHITKILTRFNNATVEEHGQARRLRSESCPF